MPKRKSATATQHSRLSMYAQVNRRPDRDQLRAEMRASLGEPPGVAGFYQRFGFRALSAVPRTLMLTLAELRAAGYP
jgi:hypothetical protein